MKKHCCICGAKAPNVISGSPWISVKADKDPAHYGCPEHKNQIDMAHIKGWRACRIGCRISPTPDHTQWNGTPKPIITNGGTDRAYKLCKCSECGIERECTPHFDFYIRNGVAEDGPLTCELCINMKKPDGSPQTNPTVKIPHNRAHAQN